jgi:hypothetical protein
MEHFQKLLDNIGIGVRLYNPYQFKTKGDMLRECRDQKIAQGFAHETMSCAHPSGGRWTGHGMVHCGRCAPCIIRRAAFKAAFGKDSTDYITDLYARALKADHSEGEQVQAFKVALARLSKNPSIARFLIHKPGPLGNDPDIISRYADLYQRGMGEVGSLLEKVAVVIK